jgi:hypothetical protein
MLSHDKVELWAAIGGWLNALAATVLALITWIYTKATKEMARSMHADYVARQTARLGLGKANIVKDTWDEVSIEQEITNTGEYTLALEGARLELFGSTSDGQPIRIAADVQELLPTQMIPASRQRCRYVIPADELQGLRHPSISTPLQMYKAEVAYFVKNLTGSSSVFRSPVG